jgi:hypothetical protein
MDENPIPMYGLMILKLKSTFVSESGQLIFLEEEEKKAPAHSLRLCLQEVRVKRTFLRRTRSSSASASPWGHVWS